MSFLCYFIISRIIKMNTKIKTLMKAKILSRSTLRHASFLLPIIAILISLSSTIINPAPVLAANAPSRDSFHHISMTLKGAPDPSKYSVKGVQTGRVNNKAVNNTIAFRYDSKKKVFVSDGIKYADASSNCVDPGSEYIKQLNQIRVIATVDGKQAGMVNVNLCGRASPGFFYIFSESMKVTPPNKSTKETGSLSGSISYKDSPDSKAKPFKNAGSSGTLSGGPNKVNIPLKFDDNGNFETIDNLVPGKYKIVANYLPPGAANQNFTKDLDIKAGKNTLSGAIAGTKENGGTSGTEEEAAAPETKPVADCDTELTSPLSWILCPLIDLGASLTDFVFKNVVKPLLGDVPISANTDDPAYKAWQGFRFLANIMLVGTMLAIVYAQARGDK